MKHTHILVVYTEMIPTARLIKDMMDRMGEKTGSNIKAKKSINIGKKDVSTADVIIFVRGADPYMARIAKSAFNAGKYCIMYLDDDLLNVPSEGEEKYKDALRTCLYWCHLLWSSNVNILKKYALFMKYPKCVEEKVFEPIKTLLPVFECCQPIRIVYAGSPSHASNLQKYIVPALNQVWLKNNKIEVTFIGLKQIDLSDIRFPVQFIPWFHNYQKYEEFITKHRYHIGLAVIQDQEFYRCKFYNKFLEYGKMGVLGIYSDCQPYRFVVKDHENGLLTQNTKESWEKNIEEAVECVELRERCVENAQKFLRKEFDIDKVLDKIIDKIPELISYRSDTIKKVEFTGERIDIRLLYSIISTRWFTWLKASIIKVMEKAKKDK